MICLKIQHFTHLPIIRYGNSVAFNSHHCVFPLNYDPNQCSTEEEAIRLEARLFTCHVYDEPLTDALREIETCRSLADTASIICTINNGKYCLEQLNDDNVTYTTYLKINETCLQDEDTCTSHVLQSVKQLLDHFVMNLDAVCTA